MKIKTLAMLAAILFTPIAMADNETSTLLQLGHYKGACDVFIEQVNANDGDVAGGLFLMEFWTDHAAGVGQTLQSFSEACDTVIAAYNELD